ncbi:MAG: ABC transporter ATP-binding protein [Candidatus Binatia bacterium]
MAAALVADFTKTFPSGATVSAALRVDPEAGLVTVLFGPSGSGKTTILRCLAGLERPEQGHVRFGDAVWSDAARGVWCPPQERRVGYLFQDFALFPHLTVAQNVAYGARGAGRARMAERLAPFGLAGLERRHPGQLSGGQQQRVALARALASDPCLLLLDEPLSALDAPAREPLRRELRRVLTSCGIPAVVVTHDRVEALTLGDRLVVIIDGHTRQSGPVHEVFTRPADLSVARTVGVETVVPARVVGRSDGLLTVEAGAARLATCDPGGVDGAVFVCIRAEDVMLERGAEGRTSARNHLAGRVVALAPEGPLVRVTVECGFQLSALVTRPARDDLGLAVGEAITAVVKATAIHVIPRDAAPRPA